MMLPRQRRALFLEYARGCVAEARRYRIEGRIGRAVAALNQAANHRRNARDLTWLCR